MVKPSQILRYAAGLPVTQWSFARDATGKSVATDDESAVCFCAEGALIRAGIDLRPPVQAANKARELLLEACNGSIASANDQRPDLMPSKWQRAIEAAEELEKAGEL